LVVTATPVKAADPALPAPLQKMQADGAQFKYMGRDLGYDAWLAVENAQEQYFYVTPDGSAFFLGVLFNKNGRAITFDQISRLRGQNDGNLIDLANAPSQKTVLPDTAPNAAISGAGATSKAGDTAANPPAKTRPRSELLWDDVTKNTHSLILGANQQAPIVYSFIDPLCPHCKELIKMMLPDLRAGRLRLALVPIGALAPESKPLAVSLLTLPDAATRLEPFVTGNQAALPMDATQSTAKVDANFTIMVKWKFDATPVSIYRGRDGKVKILAGPPKAAQTLIGDLPAL
jgi:protein-disulfide isomerase